MTSRLHFELFMQKLRTRAQKAAPEQLALDGLRVEPQLDVGSLRLLSIETAMKDARDGRSEE